VLVLLATGALPLESGSPAGIIRALARGALLPPERWALDVPPPLQQPLVGLLDPDPATRLADAGAVAAALAPLACAHDDVAAAFFAPPEPSADPAIRTVTRTAPVRRR
jgi:hypothetical protein